MDDEHHHYGLSLAACLRELTPLEAAIVKIEIETAFFKVITQRASVTTIA